LVFSLLQSYELRWLSDFYHFYQVCRYSKIEKKKKRTTTDCGRIRRVGSKASMNEPVLVNSVNYETF